MTTTRLDCLTREALELLAMAVWMPTRRRCSSPRRGSLAFLRRRHCCPGAHWLRLKSSPQLTRPLITVTPRSGWLQCRLVTLAALADC